MLNQTPNYWWRTKTFKIGLGVFVALAVLLMVLFSEQLGQLLSLFGSRAGTTQLLTIDDNPAQLEGHGFLGSGDFSDENVTYIMSPGGNEGYVTLE